MRHEPHVRVLLGLHEGVFVALGHLPIVHALRPSLHGTYPPEWAWRAALPTWISPYLGYIWIRCRVRDRVVGDS
jgi:hypothetical protein